MAIYGKKCIKQLRRGNSGGGGPVSVEAGGSGLGHGTLGPGCLHSWMKEWMERERELNACGGSTWKACSGARQRALQVSIAHTCMPSRRAPRQLLACYFRTHWIGSYPLVHAPPASRSSSSYGLRHSGRLPFFVRPIRRASPRRQLYTRAEMPLTPTSVMDA